MSYVGQTLPVDRFSGYLTETFTGDGSTTAFTLTREPHSESAVIVVINNVVQQPVEDYTVSGTTLTIDAAVASGDVIYATHTGGVLPITESATIDLQGVSDALVLDSDADTTISADTDDQIDFKAGGTDILSLTATTATFNDGVTITTADNTDTLTLKSTDADANVGPILNLHRDSGSPADDDLVGSIRYSADNDAGEQTNLFQTNVFLADASDGTEDFQFEMDGMIAGTQRNYLTMYAGGIIFNEDSQDLDFRVESNGNANMLFVSGGNDVVGIGAEGDLGIGLHIKEGDSGVSSIDAHANQLVIEHGTSGEGCGISFLAATDGFVRLAFGDSGDSNIGQIVYNNTGDLMTFEAGAGGEAMRITSGGISMGGNAEDDSTILTVKGGGDQTMISAQSTKSDYAGYVIRADAERGATVFYGLFDALSGNLGDREFYVRGDGNVYADGSFSGSGADYAEFFETKTGSAIAVGTTVVLEDNKVRASTDSDAASTIIGVVRPKSDAMMKASMVIGNCAWNHWSQKYETDDYDAFVTEEFTITEWTETTYQIDGKGVTKEVWYETDKMPSDVTAPTADVKDSDGRVIKTKAVVKTTEIDGTTKLIRKKVNSSFDKSKEYSPREKRDEWVIVGLLGQVPINKGQKTGDRWIKMRDKSDTVEEWYIR